MEILKTMDCLDKDGKFIEWKFPIINIFQYNREILIY
jgi:hypothetical protein